MALSQDEFTSCTSCPGGFCNIVLFPSTSNSSLEDSKAKLSKNLSKHEKKLKYGRERERSLRLLQFILTKQEYELLDETGDLVRLKLGKKTKKNSKRVNPNQTEREDESESFWVNDEIVSSCKMEHRPELARLAFAEFVSSDEGRDHTVDGSSSVNGVVHPPSSKEGHEDDILVCRVCYDAYLLLDQARFFLKSYETNGDDQEVTPLDSPGRGNNQSGAAECHEIISPTKDEPSHVTPLNRVPSEGANDSSYRRPLPLIPSASFHVSISPSNKANEKRDRSRSIDKSFKARTGTKKDKKQLEENSTINLLIADSDEATTKLAKRLLEKQGYRVDSVSNGEDCLLSIEKKLYSVLLLSENLSRKDAPSIGRWIRKKEKSDGCRSRTRILILVQRILSIDYHAYNDSEVDGFLPKPLEGCRLIPAIEKAVLEYRESVTVANNIEENSIPSKFDDTTATKRIPVKVVKTKHPCPDIASSMKRSENPRCLEKIKSPVKKPKPKVKTLNPTPSLQKEKVKKEDPICFDCVFHYDENTSFPYAILCDNSNSSFTGSQQQHHPWRNMIVCHDVFDNFERLKVFVLPMVTRYPGMKILLWNYPGQAFTTFTDDAILNNKFHAECLSKLLKHVQGIGRENFSLDEPFFLLGHGSGAAIATYYSAVHCLTALKGLVLVNGLSHVDTHYASVFHDCRNVFECSPESRPDLPIYFYARFLFSPGYLSKTSSSLALNIYTAVHNPITLRGRKRLCQGVLNHVDTRPLLKAIASPIISIHGENATLVRAIHASEYIKGRTSCPTIAQALRGGNRTAVVLMKGGHELFQEKKEQVALLLEQIVTGYHDNFGTAQENSTEDSVPVLASVAQIDNEQTKHEGFREKGREFEDMFLDQVIEEGRNDKSRSSWNVYQEQIICHQEPKNQSKFHPRGKESKNENPAKSAQGKKEFDPNEYPEVKEYMAWRIRRHKKRLAALDRSARIIQGALRVFMAKTMISRLKRQIAVTRIQSYIRGIFGRIVFEDKKKELWAAMLVQRAIRGHKGRSISYNKRMERKAQISVARMMRGLISRRRFCAVLKKREFGATKFQSVWRMHVAVNLLQYYRCRRNSSITVQRIFRGRLGRRKADIERDKYIFSRSQNSGIELARQMVIEHKLHATKLQSEISFLDDEIKRMRNHIEFTEAEIKNFERNVSELESKSHQLSKKERENFGVLKGTEKYQYREEKRRLDEEFSETLLKIVERKKSLEEDQKMHEEQVKSRLDKRAQFKKLEAKLAVLMEAQDSKLEFIRKKQQEKVMYVGRPHSQISLPRQGNHDGSLDRVVSRSCNSCPRGVEVASLTGYEESSRNRHCSRDIDGETERFKAQVANFYGSAEQMLQFNLVGSVLNSMAQRQFLNAIKGFQGVVPTPAVRENNYIQNQTGQHFNIPMSRDTIHIRVDCWSIKDVSKWLSEIGLEQYQSSFKEGAVDGSFLFELTDDDLRNTLGVEHKLHRKKILSAIKSLMNESDARRRQQTSTTPSGSDVYETNSGLSSSKSSEEPAEAVSEEYSVKEREVENQDDLAMKSKSVLDIMTPSTTKKPSVPLSDLDQLRAWIRHQKHDNIREALDHTYDTPFNAKNIRVQYVDKIGTVYTEAYEREPFNINRPDEHGNTLFHIAAQTGNIRIAKLLLRKGANPNHQNKQGQTPGHFAFAYKFFNFGSWLYDERNGGADDQLLNIYGLGPYDGLEEE